jgi:transcriptional regulator with XRE-family HTH domain
MGQTRRRRPKKLPRKLLAIRKALGMSQTEMAKALKLTTAYTSVSGFERGKREPDLITLLYYSKLAKVPMETLVDDKLNLTDRH